MKGHVGDSSWIMGEDFNLITSLGEKKGGRRSLDRFVEYFINFVEQSQLVDMETRNGWFTWNNRRGGEHHVASRIDIFLVLEDIAREAGEVSANVLPTTGSDHWLICLQWDWSDHPIRKPFRFEQFWIEHKDFNSMVQKWW